MVGAAGDLRETRVLQVFHRRCEGALSPMPQRVVLDLAGVTSADTKLVATLVLGLMLAPVASAQPHGYSLVEKVNPAARTVTLLGTVYQLTPRTRFYGRSGGRGDLRGLRPLPRNGGLVSEHDVDAVEFEAVQHRGRWVLLELRVLEALPR